MTHFITAFRNSAALSLSALMLLAAPAGAKDTETKPVSKTKTETAALDHVYTEGDNEHAIGDAHAPHSLIIYASVVCGHCGQWFTNDYPVIKKKLVDTGKLRLVFREFPTQPADVAIAGFQIANCAAPEQYFDAISYQFQNQEETFNQLRMGEGRARFLELAKQAGIETEDEMKNCFENKDGIDRMKLAMSRARAAKVEGVPALILDGTLMPGINGSKEVIAALQGKK